MPHIIKMAAIQLDANPAPTPERLERAANLIAEAASVGARVVVLPELFNTGYQYDPANYALAETLNGQTPLWMKAQAIQHRVHLAGSFLLRENGEIYNTALLIAPDGRTWRYDKQFPWAWERAYFREGEQGITIAETEHGKLGMMICWDSAQPQLWQAYAGKVDALLIMSCPPKMSSFDLVMPDGSRMNTRDFGGAWRGITTDKEYFTDLDMDEQAAWLGVPVVHTVGSGVISLKVPRPRWGLLSWLSFSRNFLKWVGRAQDIYIKVGFDHQTKVIDANGQVISRFDENGDGFTLAEVSLPDERPQPKGLQPPMRTPAIAYLFSNRVAIWLTKPLYRKAMQR